MLPSGLTPEGGTAQAGTGIPRIFMWRDDREGLPTGTFTGSPLRAIGRKNWSIFKTCITACNETCSPTPGRRSEEQTSELQSLMRNSYAVFCLKKKNNIIHNTTPNCR